MRKLVTIRRVTEIHPIEGADVIELAVVDGWKSIVKKEYELTAGGLCVYFEIDSHLPMEDRYEFLSSSKRKFGGVEGYRLKTMKMRGIVSQGLAQPISVFPEVQADLDLISQHKMTWDELYEKDYTEVLNVLKFEPYISPENIGKIRGGFPHFIQKTAQERCQNAGKHIFGDHLDDRYEVSLKVDGTSFTAFYADGEDGVCSRNNDLDISADNKYTRMYIDSGLKSALEILKKNYAVQGELMGPSIPGNREGLISDKLYIFNVYDIDTGLYLSPYGCHQFCADLWANGVNPDTVLHVPLIDTNKTLAELGITNMEQLLKYAEGPSIKHAIREGLVFKSTNGQFSFKVISNQYLLKQKD